MILCTLRKISKAEGILRISSSVQDIFVFFASKINSEENCSVRKDGALHVWIVVTVICVFEIE